MNKEKHICTPVINKFMTKITVDEFSKDNSFKPLLNIAKFISKTLKILF